MMKKGLTHSGVVDAERERPAAPHRREEPHFSFLRGDESPVEVPKHIIGE